MRRASKREREREDDKHCVTVLKHCSDSILDTPVRKKHRFV